MEMLWLCLNLLRGVRMEEKRKTKRARSQIRGRRCQGETNSRAWVNILSSARARSLSVLISLARALSLSLSLSLSPPLPSFSLSHSHTLSLFSLFLSLSLSHTHSLTLSLAHTLSRLLARSLALTFSHTHFLALSLSHSLSLSLLPHSRREMPGKDHLKNGTGMGQHLHCTMFLCAPLLPSYLHLSDHWIVATHAHLQA